MDVNCIYNLFMVIWGTVHYCSTHSHTILDITTCKTISNILLYIYYTPLVISITINIKLLSLIYLNIHS